MGRPPQTNRRDYCALMSAEMFRCPIGGGTREYGILNIRSPKQAIKTHYNLHHKGSDGVFTFRIEGGRKGWLYYQYPEAGICQQSLGASQTFAGGSTGVRGHQYTPEGQPLITNVMKGVEEEAESAMLARESERQERRAPDAKWLEQRTGPVEMTQTEGNQEPPMPLTENEENRARKRPPEGRTTLGLPSAKASQNKETNTVPRQGSEEKSSDEQAEKEALELEGGKTGQIDQKWMGKLANGESENEEGKGSKRDKQTQFEKCPAQERLADKMPRGERKTKVCELKMLNGDRSAS